MDKTINIQPLFFVDPNYNNNVVVNNFYIYIIVFIEILIIIFLLYYFFYQEIVYIISNIRNNSKKTNINEFKSRFNNQELVCDKNTLLNKNTREQLKYLSGEDIILEKKEDCNILLDKIIKFINKQTK